MHITERQAVIYHVPLDGGTHQDYLQSGLANKKSSLLQLPIHRGTKNVKWHLKDSISKIQALENSIGEATLFHQQYQKLKKKNGGGPINPKRLEKS